MQLVKTDDNQIFTVKDSVGIIYWENYTIYQVPHIYNKTYLKQDISGKVLSEKDLKNETKFEYLVFRDDRKYGCWFDSLGSKNGAVASVDSFEKKRLFKGFPFFKRSEYTLLANTYVVNAKILTKTYTPEFRMDQSYPDTAKYFFKIDFDGIDFSFSKELDSLAKMKLFKVDYINSPLTIGEKKIPKREHIFEIQKNQVDTTAILKFVNNFKKVEASLYQKHK